LSVPEIDRAIDPTLRNSSLTKAKSMGKAREDLQFGFGAICFDSINAILHCPERAIPSLVPTQA